jgi:hypothetical protein
VAGVIDVDFEQLVTVYTPAIRRTVHPITGTYSRREAIDDVTAGHLGALLALLVAPTRRPGAAVHVAVGRRQARRGDELAHQRGQQASTASW